MTRRPDVVIPIEELGLEPVDYVVDVDFRGFSGQCVVRAPSAAAAEGAGRTFLFEEYMARERALYDKGAFVSAHLASEDDDDD